MSNTDVSWRWDFVVFRLCNQNPTLSQRQIDVKYWRQPDFHFQLKCNVCLTSCPTSTWRYIDVWCLLGLNRNSSVTAFYLLLTDGSIYFVKEWVNSSLHYFMLLHHGVLYVLIKFYGAFSANSETLLAVAVHFRCHVQSECCKLLIWVPI